MRVYKPQEGDIITISRKVTRGKPRVGGYIYLNKNDPYLNTKFSNESRKFAIVMKYINLVERIRTVKRNWWWWVVKEKQGRWKLIKTIFIKQYEIKVL